MGTLRKAERLDPPVVGICSFWADVAVCPVTGTVACLDSPALHMLCPRFQWGTGAPTLRHWCSYRHEMLEAVSCFACALDMDSRLTMSVYIASSISGLLWTLALSWRGPSQDGACVRPFLRDLFPRCCVTSMAMCAVTHRLALACIWAGALTVRVVLPASQQLWCEVQMPLPPGMTSTLIGACVAFHARTILVMFFEEVTLMESSGMALVVLGDSSPHQVTMLSACAVDLGWSLHHLQEQHTWAVSWNGAPHALDTRSMTLSPLLHPSEWDIKWPWSRFTIVPDFGLLQVDASVNGFETMWATPAEVEGRRHTCAPARIAWLCATLA